MSILENIRGPRDLKALSEAELGELAEEIREFLIHAVARTGGHLGPNLGVVELTIALHRVFDSPVDRILWDTGHQSYVHKLLTGRQDFSKLRGKGGLSGYPSREESEHDVIENSHASTVLGWADGLAKAREVRGERGPRRRRHRRRRAHRRHGLGGAEQHRRRQGPAADHRRQRQRALVRARPSAASPTTWRPCARPTATSGSSPGARTCCSAPRSSATRVYESLHGAKKGFKDAFAPQGMFEDLGLKYVGPIDGHDLAAVESALRRAKRFHGPVLVHCLTEKGRGYEPALAHEADRFHTVGAMDPLTCVPLAPAGGPSWTSVFGDEIVAIGEERPDVVAITAAMLHPVGLGEVRRALPRPRLGRRHRRAARGRPRGGPGHRRSAPGRRGLRHLPQPGLRPAADGRGPAPLRGHVRARPGRGHRRRRRLAQRHVGHVRAPGGAGTADRRAARRRPTARPAAGGGRGGRRADRAPLPQGVGRTGRAGRRPGGRHGRAAPGRTAGRAAGGGRCDGAGVSAGRRAARGARHRLHGRRPPVGQARRPGAARPRRRTPAGGRRRGQQPYRRRRLGGGAGPARRRSRRPRTQVRYPGAVPRARQAERGARRHRAHARSRSPAGSAPAWR